MTTKIHPSATVDPGAVLGQRVVVGPGAVVNAGDGRHEHPTQALLDMLSLRRAFGDVGGLTVAICGDIGHSRVARSNVALLSMMGAWEDGLRGLGKGEKAGRAGRLDDDGRGGGRVSAVGCRRREEVYGFLHHDHGELGGGQGEGGGAKIMVVEGTTRRQATSGRGARE